MKDMYTSLHLDCGRTDGMFGVEIEVEGERLPRRGSITKVWSVEHDGSLDRNRDTAEYVFRQPLSLLESRDAIKLLEKAFDEADSTYYEAVRAGVHTHLNIQSLTPLELLTLVTTYYVLEDYFVHWSGPKRVGNHFCLRASDAESVIQLLLKTCQTKDWRHLNTEEIRYASLNLSSMFKYGSVEFRSTRSTPDFNQTIRWVELIDQLNKGAKKFANPQDVISGVSEMHGQEAFIRYVMEDLADEFLQFKNINIWEGLRVCQPIAYMIDWKAFTKEKVNPFV